jgi:hypothetical protein
MPGNWPVLFGKGPTEKDPSQGYLAGGLLHSGGGRGMVTSLPRYLAKALTRFGQGRPLSVDTANMCIGWWRGAVHPVSSPPLDSLPCNRHWYDDLDA